MSLSTIETSKLLHFDFLQDEKQIELTNVLENTLPYIKDLSKKAFLNKDKEAWNTIQKVLFKLNMNMFEKGFDPTKNENVASYLVRGTIMNVEKEATETVVPPVTEKKAFLEYLLKLVKEHPANTHPFLDYINSGKMTKEEARLFIGNYRVINEFFHLHIAILSYFSPLEFRGTMYENLNDELGQGDIKKAHPTIFKKLLAALEVPNHFAFLPESIATLNNMVSLTAFSNYLYGLGAMGALETAVPLQQSKIANGFRQIGLDSSALEFFDTHVEIDVVHGEQWFESLQEVIETKDDCIAVLNGAKSILDARVVFYDGLWNEMNKNK
ncbi:iron-containing redox enzyme family protein [Bacillus cereus]|uniref:TenA family transcriptional regulator n=1 Tax=Bacillus cereus TaxID=1396 RepID=UPI0010BF16D6|nr:iron-containing redox enzyme family protein [Bacillus cereus]TKH88723.1 iron-containing redox enzyme family protein [Bacillus cereus]